MARKRMISEAFWSDPDLDNFTAEDRLALLLLLTCQASGLIGIYRVNFKVLGAGIGWTREQTVNSCKHLVELKAIEIDEQTGWVWVKDWFKHNSLSGSFTGKLSQAAFKELANVPFVWKEMVVEWLLMQDDEGKLGAFFDSGIKSHDPSMPHACPIDDSSPTTTTNTNTGSNKNTTTTQEPSVEGASPASQGSGGGSDLKFPKIINQQEKEAILPILKGRDDAEILLDELGARLEARNQKPIGDLVAWLQALIKNGIYRTAAGLNKTAYRLKLAKIEGEKIEATRFAA